MGYGFDNYIHKKPFQLKPLLNLTIFIHNVASKLVANILSCSGLLHLWLHTLCSMKGRFRPAATQSDSPVSVCSFMTLYSCGLGLKKLVRSLKKVLGAGNKQGKCVQQALVSKLPKQILWRFTVTHVSSALLQHTHCPGLSESVCVILASTQHSSTASVWRQSTDIYSLVNTHTVSYKQG